MGKAGRFRTVDAKGELTGFEPDLAREMCRTGCTFTTLRKKYLGVPILPADHACAGKAV